MKIQTGKMLVEDMNLKPGEHFQVGNGPDAFVMVYKGTVVRNGKIYDQIRPPRK